MRSVQQYSAARRPAQRSRPRWAIGLDCCVGGKPLVPHLDGHVQAMQAALEHHARAAFAQSGHQLQAAEVIMRLVPAHHVHSMPQLTARACMHGDHMEAAFV